MRDNARMTQNFVGVSEAEEKAIVTICILAAFADGAQSETERLEIKRVAENFSGEGLDLTAAYQEALSGRASTKEVAARISSANGKALAYEMAVCICHCDRGETAAEKAFLGRLRDELKLDQATASEFNRNATALSSEAYGAPPIIAEFKKDDGGLDEMIVNRAILTGALELMPQTLATMAIVPVQLRLVYAIGKKHGYDLDWTHAREFVATLGVGMASQMVEGYLSRFVRGVTKRFAGRMVTALVGQASESALAFATTYAIGHSAKAYYAGGRTLSTGQLKDVFSRMLSQGQSLKTQYAATILDRSRNLRVADLAPLVKAA
jgi:uncharacterized protein (DUF697 family)